MHTADWRGQQKPSRPANEPRPERSPVKTYGDSESWSERLSRLLANSV